jgi:uncharacterized protein (DUF2345 family)
LYLKQNSALKINGDGVTVITPNKFTAKASQHLFTAGASESPTLPLFLTIFVGNVSLDEQHNVVLLLTKEMECK